MAYRKNSYMSGRGEYFSGTPDDTKIAIYASNATANKHDKSLTSSVDEIQRNAVRYADMFFGDLNRYHPCDKSFQNYFKADTTVEFSLSFKPEPSGVGSMIPNVPSHCPYRATGLKQIVSLCEKLRSAQLRFIPNLVGTQGRLNLHGAIRIEGYGTVHKGSMIAGPFQDLRNLGTFEQQIGLVRELPLENYKYEIQFIELKAKINSTMSSVGWCA